MVTLQYFTGRCSALVTLSLALAGLNPGLVRVDSENHYTQMRKEHTRWYIHPSLRIHEQSQPKQRVLLVAPQNDDLSPKNLKKKQKKNNLVRF